MERRERVIETIKCMRLTTHQLQVVRRERPRDNQVYASHTHQLQVERRERDIEPIKCMRSPHTSYRWRGERHRANQVMRSPHTSYRWRGERHRQSSVCAHHTPATGGEERVIEPIKCMLSPHSYRWRGERVIEQSSVCAHHTPATGGEERES